jgi:membrane-associated phospholipid phosphatase
LKVFLKNNLLVLFLYFIIAGICLYYIINYDKKIIHIFLNQFVGNAAVNLFFYYLTYLGDGRFAAFLLLIIVIFNMRLGIYAVFSFITATIISTALKYLFFDDENRPHFIFQYIDKYPLKFVDGVHMHIHNSFPSGHATQAFAILMCLVFVTSSHKLKLFIFLVAALTAASRVYLSQHWLADITAGSFIGLLCSIIYYFVFIHYNKFQRLDKPLADIRKT